MPTRTRKAAYLCSQEHALWRPGKAPEQIHKLKIHNTANTKSIEPERHPRAPLWFLPYLMTTKTKRSDRFGWNPTWIPNCGLDHSQHCKLRYKHHYNIIFTVTTKTECSDRFGWIWILKQRLLGFAAEYYEKSFDHCITTLHFGDNENQVQ